MVGEESPFHSFTQKAKKKRKLLQAPGFNNYPKTKRPDQELGVFDPCCKRLTLGLASSKKDIKPIECPDASALFCSCIERSFTAWAADGDFKVCGFIGDG